MRKFLSVLVIWILSMQVAAQLDVHEAGIRDLQAAMQAGQISSVELVDQYLARIAAYDDSGPGLNSLIRINSYARRDAAALDRERSEGRVRGPLHGIPVIIKDNYNTDFMPTTGASVALAGFVPSVNATAVQKLLDAGAVILAKSNLHEFAYGITSISSLGGQTRNPYDPRRVPGGSSGGTSAAVAASFAAIGMGSDTCGSIRIPAAFNNLFGLRPSKGVTSIYGIMPLSHTQDVIGPLAREVEDLALVLDVISGYDSKDPATEFLAGQNGPGFVTGMNSQALAGLRFGRFTEYFQQLDAPMARVLEQALEQLRSAGVEIVDVAIPDLARVLGGSGLIGHEFKPDLDQYLAEFSSSEVTNLGDIISHGLYHSAVAGVLTRSQSTVPDIESYQSALQLRTDLRLAIETMMTANDLDAIVYPPISRLQVFTGENQPGNNCSLSANSGLPAMAVPAGLTPDGLPVGLELLGFFQDDVKLVAIAHQWEQFTQPRRAPATTPALVDGQAPDPEFASLQFDEGNIVLNVEIRTDVTRSRIDYSVTNNSADPEDLHAVTLVIDTEDVPNDPLIASLAGPAQQQALGELYLTPQLWSAWQEHRLHVRIFGIGLPVEGVSAELGSIGR